MNQNKTKNTPQLCKENIKRWCTSKQANLDQIYHDDKFLNALSKTTFRFIKNNNVQIRIQSHTSIVYIFGFLCACYLCYNGRANAVNSQKAPYDDYYYCYYLDKRKKGEFIQKRSKYYNFVSQQIQTTVTFDSGSTLNIMIVYYLRKLFRFSLFPICVVLLLFTN